MSLAPGTKLGPYEIQSLLGAGGMGEVYRARDTRLDRIVAIKVLPGHLSGNTKAKERFERETRAVSALNHPNICHLYDVGSHEGLSYLIMEYLQGETLADRLYKGPLSLEQILKTVIEICEALDKAHRSGMVHRDLKPANIFITKDGHAKLLDFGLAKSCQLFDRNLADNSPTIGSDIDLTSPGSAVGTVAYMSPEQARGENIDGRSDLFSLGVVMYEMATGHRPFTGSTSALIFDSILNRQPQPVNEVSPALPAAYGSTLGRLMAKRPQDRYQSVAELSEALLEIQRAEQMAAARKTLTQRKIPSVAVLPFANLSADPDNQYFSDGLSEDLITALARLQGLRVASRISAFRFRGGSADISEVARQLNVEFVLDGSVRRSGQRLRITAELVKVADGYHLWSERYDREITDIFEIQDEITAAIIQKLEPTLAGQQAMLTRRHSENVQAYDLYLKGRRLWEQRSESSLRAGLECFRAAIDLDPEYALAYTGVADSFTILAAYGAISLLEGKPRAEAAVKKALELGPALAEPHFSMALATCFFGDYSAAEAHFRSALGIQSQSSGIHAYLGLFLAMRHRFDEARECVRKAVELDPLSPFAHSVTSLTLTICRAYEEALRHSSRALKLQPNFVLGLWSHLNAACALERWEECIAVGEKVVSVTRRSALFVGQLGRVYALAGQKEKALALIREARQRADAGEYINPACFLDIHTGLNDLESAYTDLLALRKDGENGFAFGIKAGSVLDRLAADPRCADLLRKMGLLE